jgi:hypothetical protein
MSAAHGCDDCSFRSDARDGHPRCSLRNFAIGDAMFTTCGNHPLRNPLRLRKLIGPIWTTIAKRFDFIPGTKVSYRRT